MPCHSVQDQLLQCKHSFPGMVPYCHMFLVHRRAKTHAHTKKEYIWKTHDCKDIRYAYVMYDCFVKREIFNFTLRFQPP